MQGEISEKKKRKRKTKKLRTNLNVSQEKASSFFFIGLLIIAIFGCVASGAPRQEFYGIIFLFVGILITLFPPIYRTSKWLKIGLILFFIFSSASLLPRAFASNQNWRISLEQLGLQTGKLITPHPAATIESLILIGSIIIIGLCALGHRISRDGFLKIASSFVFAVATYAGISIAFVQNDWEWKWNPNNEFGFFANRNHMATLLVMASIVGIGSVFIHIKKKSWISLIIILTAIGTICWGILGFSISRSGLILFLTFQTVWFIFAWKKYLNYKLKISFLVLFSLAIFLFFISDTRLEDRLGMIYEEKYASSVSINNFEKDTYHSFFGLREYIQKDALRMMLTEPWTGTGLGTFQFIFPQYIKESILFNSDVSNMDILHPESNWLDLATQAGVLSVLIALACVFLLLNLMFRRNRTSRSWLLSVSCILSVICVLVHGIIDVPAQKVGIVVSCILLIGISSAPNNKVDKYLSKSNIVIYQLLGIGIFSFGLTLVHSHYFSSTSISFSDPQTRINKIQKLYQLSIDSFKEKNIKSQKKYLLSAINLTESAIKRSPLDPELHYIRGKIYSMIGGYDHESKMSFEIESFLDSNWVNLPLRQSEVWLFVDLKEARRLWVEALKRANRISDTVSRYTWNKILNQAKRHPIQIRGVYEIILNKDDPYYIEQWMKYAGRKNLSIQIPKVLQSDLLSGELKENVSIYWKKLYPKDYKKYSLLEPTSS